MKNLNLPFILIFFFNVFTAVSQENFEKGFIIDLQGDTIYGFIDNPDRLQNPEKVIFKSADDSTTVIYLPENIGKYMVGRDLYKSAHIYLPKESDIKASEVNENKLVWVYLLTVAEGTRSLYYYTDNSLLGYYYIEQDHEYTLLNYRDYVTTDENGVKTAKKDQRYKGQLILYLGDCSKLKDEISAMTYNEKAMNKLFTKYYSCQSETAYLRKMKKSRFEFGALGGISFPNVIFKTVDEWAYISPVANADYQSSVKPEFGLFGECIFPKNHEKLSLFAEGLYSSIHIQGEYVRQGSVEQNHTDYTDDIYVQQASVNLALRYKIFPGAVKLFFDAGVSYAFTLSSETSLKSTQYYYEIIIEEESEAIEIKSDEQCFFAGMGLEYSRLSLEARYKIGNGITAYGDLASTESKTRQVSIVLGIRIL